MRKATLAMIGLTAVIVAVFCSYSSAFGKPAAHHIPVAVAASPAVLAKLETSPALRVYQVRDLAAARSMVEDRAVDGSLVLLDFGAARQTSASGSTSGMTATVAVEVWMRPWVSVAGTRCTRCTPDSYLR